MGGGIGILLGQKNRRHGGDCAWETAGTKGRILAGMDVLA